MTKKTKLPKQPTRRRESPQDFMLSFLAWQKKNPDRHLTPKGFAIVRGAPSEKEKP